MTIIDRINTIINSNLAFEEGDTPASIEKMIYAAYWIGREAGAKETADAYNARLDRIKASAGASRYHKMILETIGNCGRPYSQDYAGDITETYGSDLADI